MLISWREDDGIYRSSWAYAAGFFLGNEAARHCWTNGHADTILAIDMSRTGTSLEASLMVEPPLFARVLTSSDLADGPTKTSFDIGSELGAERIRQDEPFLRRCALSNP